MMTVAKALVIAFILFLPAQDPPGQPDMCVNHGGDPAHTCMCHQTCDPLDPDKVGGDDPLCKTYCTKEHCHCKMVCKDT